MSDFLEDRVVPLCIALPAATITVGTIYIGLDGGYYFFTLTPLCLALTISMIRAAIRGRP